jgi:hypothetical protein
MEYVSAPSPAPAQSDAGSSLSVQFDEDEMLVRIVGIGMWTPEQLRGHYLNCDRVLKAMRADYGAARVLVDLSRAPVQTGETAAVIREWTPLIYKPSDHVAVVCVTTLFTLQIKRETSVRQLETFADMPSAVAWLTSFPLDRHEGSAGASR